MRLNAFQSAFLSPNNSSSVISTIYLVPSAFLGPSNLLNQKKMIVTDGWNGHNKYRNSQSRGKLCPFINGARKIVILGAPNS